MDHKAVALMVHGTTLEVDTRDAVSVEYASFILDDVGIMIETRMSCCFCIASVG